MTTITEAIRNHALEVCGVTEGHRAPDIDVIRQTEWSDDFERLRLNRMIMGFLRYGPVANSLHDNMASLRQEVALFQNSGNAEHLLNAANYAMIEWMQKRHPQWHFSPEDDKQHAIPMNHKCEVTT